MRLELMAAQAVAWARTVECALHDPGPWEFRTAAGNTPAHRILDRERTEIVFVGVVEPSPDGIVELWAGDRMVTVASFDLTQGDRLTWKMSLREQAPAS